MCCSPAAAAWHPSRERDARTTAHAIHALAAITGVELRFDGVGASQPLADVAADYRAPCGR